MAGSSDGYLIVLTTAGSDEQGETIARALVDRRLAACVNMIGQNCSVFRWKDQVVREEEKLLLIKTTARRFEQVRQAIHELHTYETPEVVALPIQDGDADYLAWLTDNVTD